MMHVQILTLKGCLHIHLLAVESFSVLIESLTLRDRPSMIRDVTVRCKVNIGPIGKLYKGVVETWG